MSAVQDSLLWRNLEDKNPPAKVIRAALAKAPLMPDISSSILHMWQALENIIRIQSEITYRTSLLLAELCAPIQPRSLTYDTAKRVTETAVRSHMVQVHLWKFFNGCGLGGYCKRHVRQFCYGAESRLQMN